MLYRNFTIQDQFITVNMMKKRIAPGGIVNISRRDITHAGSNMRNFESVIKSSASDGNGFDKLPIKAELLVNDSTIGVKE